MKHLYFLALFSLLVACGIKPRISERSQHLINTDNQLPEQNINPDGYVAIDTTDANEDQRREFGIHLYQRYCASCHNSYEASTKKGSTLAALNNAITNISEMKHLSFLLESDRSLIILALNSKNTGDSQQESVLNRLQLASKFRAIYTSPGANTTELNAFKKQIEDRWILTKYSVFGAPCTRYDESCSLQRRVNLDDTLTATGLVNVDSTPSPLRSGLLNKACFDVSRNTANISNLLRSVAIDPRILPSLSNFEKLAKAYRLSWLNDDATKEKVKTLLEKMSSQKVDSLMQWQILSYIYCSSSLMEAL